MTNKFIFLFTILLFLISCQQREVIKTHGIAYLKKREKLIIVNETNKNDVVSILGQPSTKGMTDNNVWIYIERKKTNRSIFALGTKKTVKNNVAVLEIDNKGLLVSKKMYDLDKMNKYKFSENNTNTNYEKNSYIYGVLTSLREKINAPAKRKKVSD